MRWTRRVDSRTSIYFTLAIALLCVVPAAADLESRGKSLLVDDGRGLTWIADGRYVVNSGLADRAMLPRAEALEVIERLNAGWVENFGHRDWRLPTAREVDHLLAEGAGFGDRTGDDPALVRVMFEADRAAGAAGAGGSDLVVVWPVRGSLIEPGFPDVVLFATNSMRLKNQAEVMSGDVVVNDAGAGPTLVSGFELGFDPRAETAAGYAVKADSVRIKNNAEIGGDVHYNDLDNKGEVHGALITPLDLPVFDLLPLFIAQPPAPGSPDVEVDRDGFVILPPGDYGDVTVDRDGTVVFTGGHYNVRSIDAGRDVALLFQGPSQVRVEGRLLTDRDVFVGPEEGSGTPVNELVFYVAGLNDGPDILDFPIAAELHHDVDFNASIYAPNGTLRIGHGTEATGAFLARDVLVENQALITLDSYFFNRPPSAEDDSATVDEGGTVTMLDSGETSVLANDTDPDGDALTVTTTPVSGPSNGTLILNADGTFSYTHDGSETTSDEFVYEACDGGFPVLCDTATVSITVVPVNDPPEAGDDSATVDQGGTVTVLDSGETSVLANDTDAENDNLTVDTTPVSGPSNGTLILNADGTFSYTHNGSETVSDAFVYEVCDDGSPVECDTATVSITVLTPHTLTVVRFGLGDGRVFSTPAGIDCGPVCSAQFSAAVPVTLTAEAFVGSTFGGFSGDPDCADGVVTVDADKICLARFDLDVPDAVLTVTLAGTGSGRVTSNPEGIDCPGTCSADFPIPTRVFLTAIADEGSQFDGWSGDPDCADGIVDVLADTTCTATFVPEEARITLVRFGLGTGTVTSDPAGIDCGVTCTAVFDPLETVTLTAVADEGSTFGGFSGDPDCADGVVTAAGHKTCLARFDLAGETGLLTVALAGDGGGTVTSDPAGIDCPATSCSASYPIPTRVTLTPVADAGSAFDGWSGDPDCTDGIVDVVADVSCTATFVAVTPPATHTLTVLFLGAGTGFVTSNPPNLGVCTGDCSADFPDGTEVILQARPDGTFGGWGGDCSGGGFSTTVTLDADKTCTATFEP